jgi:thioredoxin-related protein
MNRQYLSGGFIVLVITMLFASCSSNKQNRLYLLSDTGWQETDSLDISNKKQILFFFDSECPVCNLYTHTLSTLSKDYQSIGWILIIPKHSDTANAYEYFKSVGFKGLVMYDKDNFLVKKYKATTTPQVILINKGNTVYSGKIDDKVKALGSFKDQSSSNYLRDAIEALLVKKEPQIKYTKPVGCLIQ